LRFFDRPRLIIQESKEVVVASTVASRNDAFKRLGLTDAALLEVVTAETPLVTVDFDLYRAALAKGQDGGELHLSSEPVIGCPLGNWLFKLEETISASLTQSNNVPAER